VETPCFSSPACSTSATTSSRRSCAARWSVRRGFVALDDAERDAILAVLDDLPDDLVELRAVLLREHTARARGEMA
jgi:hypothetical protein